MQRTNRALLFLVIAVFITACSPSPEGNLRRAIATGDGGEILRAFHRAIYDRSADMSTALPAIKAHLHERDPWVRYVAAKALYTAGDQSGLLTLVELVETNDRIPEPLDGSKEDLRLQAARVLGKFRQTAAAAAVVNLYHRTNDGGLVQAMKKLGARDELLLAMKGMGYFSGATYGTLAPPEFIPKLQETFAASVDLEAKNAAAYSLARLTGEPGYISFLIDAAEPAIDGRQTANGYNLNTNALRYLGSIQHPLAREALERALDSPNSFARVITVVNLLFNQPGRSEKARHFILHQLKGPPLLMESWELTFQIAAKLDDPEIRAAGEAFDRHSGDRSWKVEGVARKNWPIYNWIDDYVVELYEQ